MPMIDERGRLFGRFNLIDVAMVAAVAVVLPVAYFGYVLFRPAPITLVSIEPSSVVRGRDTRVRLTGAHLRPYLRAQVGHDQLHNFLIESPTAAEIVVPDLPPGIYDITLYDEVDQVARMSGALTVLPPPQAPSVVVRLRGAIAGLDEAAARRIAVGQKYTLGSASLEIVEAGPPQPDVRPVKIGAGGSLSVDVPVAGKWQVPAALRVACELDNAEQRCKVGDAPVGPGLTLPLGGERGFLIGTVSADTAGRSADVTVRFMGPSEVIDELKVNDRDTLLGRPAATLTSLLRRQALSGQTSVRYANGSVEETITRTDQLASVDAVIRLTVEQSAGMLAYNGAGLRIGGDFVFSTGRYQARGTVLRIDSK